ncbi:Centrosomal protein of 131 kDa [Boothiomyces macroporosus]|uniref:Centrosomal protein of 131 kDa n=1 Tax=Boothiomyces macroporosus TaxID=261099 RepID=A0AAD5UMT9_9FUNG|nr:Centrosomal protein of 131 kDa [Boothiomyces macroporosus]
MFKRQPATSHLTVKSKTVSKPKKVCNPKKKILKSGSTDTLVSEPLSRPSKSFLELLNSKATIIQKWYRRIRKNSSIANNASAEVGGLDVNTSVVNSLDENTNEIVEIDAEEQKRQERRRLLAEKAKAEILNELAIKNNVFQASTSENPVLDVIPEYSATPESQEPAKEESPSQVVEEDISDTVQAVNSYYSGEIPAFPPVKFQYEDDFDEYDPIEESTDVKIAQGSPLIEKIESVPDLNQEEFPPTCIDMEEIEIYIEKLDNHQIEFEQKDDCANVGIAMDNCFISDQNVTLGQPLATDQQKESAVVSEIPKVIPESKKKGLKVKENNSNKCQESVKQRVQQTKESQSITQKKKAVANPPLTISKDSVDDTDRNPFPKEPDQVGDRVTRILDFLKSVEEEAATPMVQSKPNNFADLLKDQSNSAPESSAAVFEGVKTKMMQLQMEIDSKRKTIEALKSELSRNKEIAKEEMTQHQKSLKSQLSLQRKEYETIVKRHLTFIDKLLAEKEEISKKSVELTEKVKNLDTMYQEKLKNMEESQQRDLKQHREMWQAAEKIKRDKWIQEKTKAIKDQTVLGLEPEIQKLIAQHKVQLRQAEESYRESLAKEKSVLIDQHQRQLEQIRDKYISERQKACEEEREFSRQRYMKQLEREEMEFQQQKRKLLSEFADERMRLNEAAKDNLKNEEALRKRALDSLRKEMEQERIDRDNMMAEQSKKHMAELNQLREKFQIEKEEWQANYMKKVEMSVRAKEKQFKEQLIQQRDAEIEMVIQRLESETGSSNSDATRRYRMDIERIKSETAEEIKQLRDQHSMALDKLLLSQQQVTELQASLRDAQKEILQLQHANISKDGLLKKQKQELERLNGDESSLISQLKSEHEQELLAKMQEINQLKQAMHSLESDLEAVSKNYSVKLQQIELDKDQTINHLEKQIVQALKAKDDYIGKLKGQLEEAVQRATHLETLIEQQRNELLGSL